MKSYYDVIKKALEIYVNRSEYAYFYGAKGVVLTDNVMESLIQAEPAHFSRYNETELKKIKDYSRGKIGYDCSGFVSACAGYSNWSVGFIEDSKNKTTPALGTEGNVLFSTWNHMGRHVGIDIGYGFFIDFPTEGDTARLGQIKKIAWEQSGQINGIDYTGAKN